MERLDVESDPRPLRTQLSTIDEAVESLLFSPQEKQIERVAEWTFETFGAEYFAEAKASFFEHFGMVFYDDSLFHHRMLYFLNHFVLEYFDLKRSNPYLVYQQQMLDSSEDFSWDYRHSLFEIKSNSTKLVVDDLIIAKTYTLELQKCPRATWLSPGAIIQGYVFFPEGLPILALGYIEHPRDTRRLIKAKLNRLIKREEFKELALLQKLASLNIRSFRHPHVASAAIYNAGFKA